MRASFLILPPLLLFGAAGRTCETGLAKPEAGRPNGPAGARPPEPPSPAAATLKDPATPMPFPGDCQAGMDPARNIGLTFERQRRTKPSYHC